ncbi:hypothetical protein WA026_014507 [Henosepilachna vigintioctopunctata]|uniref:Uncharacterized protein n=1 Tax=Henosepilachna vigintioctopunctata TaxID=420089 RepID=A0AAW1UBT8_9CUCU
MPVSVFQELTCLEIQEDELSDDRSDHSDKDFEVEDDSVRRGFNQNELNNLVRDLGLSKKASELLASRLYEKFQLEQGAKVSYLRSRESAFQHFFRSADRFVYCHNLADLMKE